MTSALTAIKDFRSKLISRRTTYRHVFDTEPGHRVMADLRKFCRMGQDILVPGDPQATAYNVGRQRVYLRIEAILKMDAETIDAINTTRSEL